MPDAASRRREIFLAVAAAAKAARRSAGDITVVAVSKRQSVDAIADLIAAGQRDFGESRVQEAQEKWPALKQAYPDCRLHMIGRLQSNKADDAITLFDTIQSVDRLSLVDALSAAAKRQGRFPACFVQVNIGDEAQKGGVAMAELGPVLAAVRASPLPLAGLMAIPPAGAQASPYFARLADLARRHDVGGLSMGMSADYPAAIMLGATMIRVGTAFFAS